MISKQKMLSILKYIRVTFVWVLLGIVLGALIGVVGAVFAHSVNWVTALRTAHPLLVLGLPLAGTLIVALYHAVGIGKNCDTNLVLMSVRSDSTIPLAMAPLIFFSTILTHLFGGSAGREGAALQLGGSISQNIAGLLHMKKGSRRILTMCGMSACFAALFGTPMAAAFFAMEVVSVGMMYYSALVPCVLSSITAALVAKRLGVLPEHFTVHGIPGAFNPADALRVFILAALCGIVSILFCAILKYTALCYKKCFRNRFLRAACGGLLILVFTLILGSQEYLGAGISTISRAFDGEAEPLSFLLKILFTAVTLEAGFQGGEIVPAFCVGATFGCTIGALLGLHPSFGAAVGMIALFCGVTNCPVASLLLSLELFGSANILWYLLAAAVSYVFSGYFGLYSKQKILYSKVASNYIDITAH